MVWVLNAGKMIMSNAFNTFLQIQYFVHFEKGAKKNKRKNYYRHVQSICHLVVVSQSFARMATETFYFPILDAK